MTPDLPPCTICGHPAQVTINVEVNGQKASAGSFCSAACLRQRFDTVGPTGLPLTEADWATLLQPTP